MLNIWQGSEYGSDFTKSLSLSNHKKRKDSLETHAEPAVLCVYVKNQAILEPILL